MTNEIRTDGTALAERLRKALAGSRAALTEKYVKSLPPKKGKG